VRIKSGDWIVVCDGRKALILENAGNAMSPNLRAKEMHEHDNAKTSEQGTDRPGRVHESSGTSRSSVEQTDWHAQAETEFLHRVAARLDEALSKEQARSLIVVAPPRALGELRSAYSQAVKEALRAEIAKDLVNMPIHEIEKLLTR
jgi:protein required for attachment to host cells